jgi:hypothetical protein
LGGNGQFADISLLILASLLRGSEGCPAKSGTAKPLRVYPQTALG